MLYQLISLTGAVLVLLAYFAYQRGWMGRENRWYNLMNLVGSGLLAWIAIVDRRWGFILLEVLWALLSVPPLVRPPAAASGRGSKGGDDRG